jgi:hypothetical protein
MVHDVSASEHGNDTSSRSLDPNDFPTSERGKEISSVSPNDNILPEATPQKKTNTPPSALRQNLFMIFITLTQLVQMIPLGAGINSGLAIGEALGATHIESVWLVASHSLTQGAFVLIVNFLPHRFPHIASCNGMRLNFFFTLIRWPSGCRLWSQNDILSPPCVVDSLGFVRWILRQLRLHMRYERPLWHKWRPDESEHCGFAEHHLPARKKAEPCSGSFWSNGACRCSWWFSCLRSHRPVVRVEVVVLSAATPS